MLLNSHILAHATCLAGKVCSLVRSTWGTSQGEDKLGARDKILDTKVARRARARQTFPRALVMRGRLLLSAAVSCCLPFPVRQQQP